MSFIIEREVKRVFYIFEGFTILRLFLIMHIYHLIWLLKKLNHVKLITNKYITT